MTRAIIGAAGGVALFAAICAVAYVSNQWMDYTERISDGADWGFILFVLPIVAVLGALVGVMR